MQEGFICRLGHLLDRYFLLASDFKVKFGTQRSMRIRCMKHHMDSGALNADLDKKHVNQENQENVEQSRYIIE